MHSIMNIGARLAPIPPQANSSGSQNNASGFQMTVARPPGTGPAQPASTGPSSSLDSQTVSTLLQTQDLSQQVQGHGGGHHGGMKMLPGIETEEAAGEEEVQSTNKRRKFDQTTSATDVAETEEADEDGSPVEENVPKDPKKSVDSSLDG